MSNIISQKGAITLLILIFDNPKKSTDQLLEISNFTKYNINKLLNTFEMSNLIEKEIISTSNKLISLTKIGIEAVKKIKEVVKIIETAK